MAVAAVVGAALAAIGRKGSVAVAAVVGAALAAIGRKGSVTVAAVVGAALAAIALLALSTTSHAQAQWPADMAVVEMGAGQLFVDQGGFTLYTYKQDQLKPGSSACVEDCVKQWPPLAPEGGAEGVGDWSVIRRPDGSDQWAYKSRPVYRHALDTHPGAMVGEKASVQWDVLFEPFKTPSGVIIQGTELGQVLADVEGHRIYANIHGECDGDCMAGWHPVNAPWIAQDIGEHWEAVPGEDGAPQWAYQGARLFIHPAQGTGEPAPVMRRAWLRQGWEPVVIQEPPASPGWVTFQETDLGPVLATQNRMTIYSVVGKFEDILRYTCDLQCVQDNWDPVIAPAGTEPVGNWSTTPLDSGELQWTYLGRPIFTYKYDHVPGDTKGDKFATGVNIRGGWRAILRETLIQKLF